MKFFNLFFAARSRQVSLATVVERERFGRTMPGQTGAVAAARLGFLVQ